MEPVVITGGPGAGKTSIIINLASRGYHTYEESSRSIIEQQLSLPDGILPWTNLAEFADLCLDLMLHQKKDAQNRESLSFLDRAIPDICAYLKLGKLEVSNRYLEASNGYGHKVFFCVPNDTIYSQDAVRPHSYQEALEVHQLLVDVYKGLGYKVIEVPWGKIEERANFILKHVG